MLEKVEAWVFGPPARNRKNTGFGLPYESISRKIGKLPENWVLGAFSHFLGLFFSYFLGEAETNIFLFFSYLGPEA